MATRNTGPLDSTRGDQWMSTAASLTVGAAFFALWFWLLPGWLGFRVDTSGAARWRWLAVIPSILGFSVALRCIWGLRLDRPGHAGTGGSAKQARDRRPLPVRA